MTKPTRNWLLDPVFPTSAPVPTLDAKTRELAEMHEPGSVHGSGTWLVGSRFDRDDEEDDAEARFATSDSEAPTVRPGSLHAAKAS